MAHNLEWLEQLPKDRLLAEMSLWSADLVRMKDEIARIDSHTDIYHLDVADGRFSPALLFFPDFVAQIRACTSKPMHVHLMVDDGVLFEQIDQFAEAGADLISIHAENANAAAGLERIKARGLAAGIVLQLHTPVQAASHFLPVLDMLTLLGTRIGIKGQGLDPAAGARLGDATQMISDAAQSHRIVLAADGGIRENTVPGLRACGAETIVMGSLAFNAPDLAARMAWVHAQPRP